ncbi:MAG TPA: hypothetical protein VHZ55_33190 [Bryobacteraceae bacterium]|jgi:hypothetical protein|nr:hypothetical protein [Bryobacteraceae bacterium]
MVHNLKSALLIFGTIIAVSNVAPAAKADEWNKETIVTFSAAVEVPGKNLPAGTYVFELADSHSGRDTVEIFTEDKRQLLATFNAVPKARQTPANTTIVTVEEASTRTSEAVKSWFYPGDTDGLEFVYQR